MRQTQITRLGLGLVLLEEDYLHTSALVITKIQLSCINRYLIYASVNFSGIACRFSIDYRQYSLSSSGYFSGINHLNLYKRQILVIQYYQRIRIGTTVITGCAGSTLRHLPTKNSEYLCIVSLEGKTLGQERTSGRIYLTGSHRSRNISTGSPPIKTPTILSLHCRHSDRKETCN